MKSYFGYIRVSTAKQGTHGVSLAEQKAAIERYAARSNLVISEWFEERETAAKRGRPVFNRMLALLRRGTAHGVVIHKIDRSARNLKDWADLGDLIDAGVDVHFAADALDLTSRGGRLSADIQAVVAADYIRNLREETRKGFYGRLKQGLYPIGAPIGYLNNGGGKPKTVDRATAPLVRTAFELYASGKHSLRSLQAELAKRGLRNRRGRAFSINGVAKILTNPFYCGVIRLRMNGETFKGVHAPTITTSLFERVQMLMHGKTGPKVLKHEFLFRRLISCGSCGRALVGERVKGYTYYRCHTMECPTTAIREDRAEAALRAIFSAAQLSPNELADARAYLNAQNDVKHERAAEARTSSALRVADAHARLDRLTDALVDGVIDRAAHDTRRERLLFEIARLEEDVSEGIELADGVAKKLELAGSLILGYDFANMDEKRAILESACLNFSVSRKNPAITLFEPFSSLAKRSSVTCGGPKRVAARTSDRQQFIREWIDSEFSEAGGITKRTNAGVSNSSA